MTAPGGNIVLLNGTGSAGKTSIARQLQALCTEPYLHLGMDVFYLEVCPPRYLFRMIAPGVRTSEGARMAREAVLFRVPEEGSTAGTAIVTPPFGHQLMSGMHHAIAALAGTGHHVVVDHVLWEPTWLGECVRLWRSFPVLFVGVRCPLEIAERREAVRTDRSAKGVVRWQFDRVHAHGDYDLDVDTSIATPLECALRITDRLQHGPTSQAFKRLEGNVGPTDSHDS